MDPVVDGLVIADVGVGGDHHQPHAVAAVRGQQIATGAQGAETGSYEHGDDRAGGVTGVDHVGLVTLGTDEVAQFQAGRCLRPVGAGVNDLSVHAGDRLRGLEVLLVGQANGVGQYGEAALALVVIPWVVIGDAYFQVTQLARLFLDRLGDVLAGCLGSGLHLGGGSGSHNQVAVELVMLLADLAHLSVKVAQSVRPVAGCPFRDVHGFQRIFAGVPVGLTVGHRNSGNSFQFLRNRNRDFGVAPVPSGSHNLMPNLKHISLLASWLCRCMRWHFQ
ncbi:hypothetical protein GBAR_LOCUS17422, partial [Geodia barretti]